MKRLTLVLALLALACGNPPLCPECSSSADMTAEAAYSDFQAEEFINDWVDYPDDYVDPRNSVGIENYP